MNINNATVLYIFIGITLAIGLISHYAPHDPRLAFFIEHTIERSLEQHYHLNISLKLKEYSVFGVLISDIVIHPLHDSSWSLSIASLKLSLSLDDSIRYAKPSINAVVDRAIITSQFQDYLPAFLAYCKNSSLGGGQWYAFNQITIKNALGRFDHPQAYLQGGLDGVVQIADRILHGECSYTAGQCAYDNQPYIEQAHGRAKFRLDCTTMNLEALLKGSLSIPGVPGFMSTWNYQARYLNQQSIMTLSTPNASACLQIAPLIITSDGCRAQLNSFIFIDKLFGISSLLGLEGFIKSQAHFSWNAHQWNIQGSMIAKDLSMFKNNSHDIVLNFGLNNTHVQASCTYRNQQETRCYQLQGNPAHNHFIVTPRSSLSDAMVHKLAIKTNDWLIPQSFFIFNDHEDASIARIDVPKKNQPLKATLDYQLIRPVLEHYTRLRLLGNSILNVTVQPSASSCTIDLNSQGNIYFPIIYNFMRSLNVSMQAFYETQQLCIHQVQMLFEKGSMAINDAYLAWKDSKEPSSWYIPLSFSNIFINHAKHAYAWLSGELVLEKNDHATLIKADITIDKSSFYANPFSKALQKTVRALSERSYKAHQAESDLHIQLRTAQPMIIKTSLLKALVDAHIAIQGTTSSPLVSGVLSIRQGELLFAYKPLSLVSGHITLLPHRHHDPLIEFIARGTVRRYQVTMHCQGSVNNPELYLSSTPTLSQEQIVTLLMTGSPEGSLGLIMPSLILNNLHTLLFDEQPSHAQEYVKTILSPLRYVKFVPNFADQSARGGFRGSIEVDVGNNLRATIKKNFSLLEDTKIEVEYTLSDDVTIRALKDERGDLGGEVEMCFKF